MSEAVEAAWEALYAATRDVSGDAWAALDVYRPRIEAAIRAEGLDRVKFLQEDAARQWNLATSKVDKAYHAGRMTALSDVLLTEAER